MRIAFFGSPPFAARMLSEVASAGHDIAVVYTQPEKQRGRGRAVRPTPVQDMAEHLGLPVRTPASMRAEGERIAFEALKLDAAIVVAYGQILRRDILDAPRLGCFNLHASLLPRWRGAAPIQRAIMAGDAVTGVQVMRMTEGLDEGPVLSTATVPIEPDDTAGSLHDKLMEAAARLLPQTLRAIENGEARETPQPSSGATYARKIAADETRIDWTSSAVDLDRRIRGLSPHPGAWFELPTAKGRARVKVLSCRIGLGEGAPGEVLDDALLVACGQGALRLLRLQREGRTAQDADDFLRGVATDTLLQLS